MRLNRSIFKPKNKSAQRVENKDKESKVYIYDEISWWGVDPNVFVKDLVSIDSDTIHLHINSPGGSVFDGMTIYNALKSHKAKIITHIDGLAASIASIIALAGDEIVMGEGSFLMIHDPWSVAVGGADELRKEADLLEKVAEQIAGIYENKTGKSVDEISEMMAFETWMTGPEALEKGFIDRVEEPKNAKNKAKPILFDLSVFANTPAELMENIVITERTLEKALRDAGCSRTQAKAILSEGMPNDLRDVEKPDVEQPKVLDQREAEKAVQREAEKPVEKKDKVAELLIRAEKLKSTLGENTDEND
jgi:ATP-dependent Clp protease protease subunit